MKQLKYGAESIALAEDVDTDELGKEIAAALVDPNRNGPWVETTASNGVVHTILVSAGVPIQFLEREPQEPRSVVIV